MTLHVAKKAKANARSRSPLPVSHRIPTLEDLEAATRPARRPARPRAHRLQRAARGRPDHRRLPHPRRPADAELAPGARRPRRRGEPPRPPQGPARSPLLDGARARPARRARPRRRAAREPALRPGRGSQRRPFRPRARRRHRRLRQRCLRRVAPRPRVDRRTAALRAVGDGAPAAARSRGAAPTPRVAQPAVRRRARRGQGQRQARRDRGPPRHRRRPGHRRRDVLHVPRRPGPPDRRLAVRTGPGRHVPQAARPRRPSRSICRPTSSASTPTARSRRSAPACPTAPRGSTSARAPRPSSATS